MTVYQIRKSVIKYVCPKHDSMVKVKKEEVTLLPTLYGRFDVAMKHKPEDIDEENYKVRYHIIAQDVVME